MAKKALFFALGGHIANQNASFLRLAESLNREGYEVHGAIDGFNAFETGYVVDFNTTPIPERFAGFVAGANRASLKDKETNEFNPKKIESAKKFFDKGKYDVIVTSSGDDHSKEAGYLDTLFPNLRVFSLNKTMDNDLGGKDGIDGAPFTDFTNGFHTAVDFAINAINMHYSGAWTNNCPYLIGLFGRETNWVSATSTYYSNADRLIYGELENDSDGHDLDKIFEIIRDSQKMNYHRFNRSFAMIVLPEGTRIKGIRHISGNSLDEHGHPKLNPEDLVNRLKERLEQKPYNLKTQSLAITYEMRNSPPTLQDLYFARISADKIAAEILSNDSSGLSVGFRLGGENYLDTQPVLAPIDKMSVKRFVKDYENHNGVKVIDYDNFLVTNEIKKYYNHLFRNKQSLEEILPKNFNPFNIYE